MLAESKQGRLVLVVGSGYLGLQYLVSQTSTAVLVGVGATLLVLALIIAHFIGLRRRRKSRASTLQLLSFFGLLLLAVLGAVFVILRRRRPAALDPVPSAADIDRWAQSGVAQRL